MEATSLRSKVSLWDAVAAERPVKKGKDGNEGTVHGLSFRV